MDKKSLADRVFTFCNTLLMLILMFLFAYPVYYVLCASFSDYNLLIKNPGLLYAPKGFGLGAYKLAFQHPLILSGFKNIAIIMVCSLPLNLVMTWLCGYFMAGTHMMLKKPVVFLITFTMFFSGGLIPEYLNINSLGLYNSLWSLILPGCLSVYNAIICKTAIESVPGSLYESARIDGANDWTILFRIVVPLIMPTTAVLLLYYGVGHWNGWFRASIYIQDNMKLPIQNILRAVLIANSQILNDSAGTGTDAGESFDRYAEVIKYAAIVVTTLPILFIYPALQKYFVKGVMIGAVKG